MTETDAFRQAINAQETGELFHILVTVEHPDLIAPIRLNAGPTNVVSRGLPPFLASFVEATIIDQDPTRSPQAQLAFSNVNRETVIALQSTPTPCIVTMEIVKGSDLDTVERSLSNLELRNVEGDEMTIRGDLTPARCKPKKAVDYYFSPTTAPGLFQ
jgi:hypothetical protein